MTVWSLLFYHYDSLVILVTEEISRVRAGTASGPASLGMLARQDMFPDSYQVFVRIYLLFSEFKTDKRPETYHRNSEACNILHHLTCQPYQIRKHVQLVMNAYETLVTCLPCTGAWVAGVPRPPGMPQELRVRCTVSYALPGCPRKRSSAMLSRLLLAWITSGNFKELCSQRSRSSAGHSILAGQELSKN